MHHYKLVLLKKITNNHFEVDIKGDTILLEGELVDPRNR